MQEINFSTVGAGIVSLHLRWDELLCTWRGVLFPERQVTIIAIERFTHVKRQGNEALESF